MIKTRSDSTQVWVTNADQISGGASSSSMNIINSAGWIVNVANTSPLVSIQNSAGWIVSIANTVAGGDIVQISNSAGWVVSIANTVAGGDIVQISNSAGWIVNVANTGGSVVVSNTQTAINIINSAGWIFAQSNTSPLVSVQNSAGWIVAVSNTNNVVSVANTGGSIVVSNSSNIANTYDTSYVMDGPNRLVFQYGTINITNSTNTVIVKAISDKRIRVISAFLISQGTGLLTWQSGSSSGIGLTGPVYLAANVGYVLPEHQGGWFQTGTSTLLNLNFPSATSIGGCLTYLATS